MRTVFRNGKVLMEETDTGKLKIILTQAGVDEAREGLAKNKDHGNCILNKIIVSEANPKEEEGFIFFTTLDEVDGIYPVSAPCMLENPGIPSDNYPEWVSACVTEKSKLWHWESYETSSLLESILDHGYAILERVQSDL